MLQRNPNSYRNRRVGIIGGGVVAIAAIATLVIANVQGADDEPARPNPDAVAEQAAARQQLIEDAAGSDHHLDTLAGEIEKEIAAHQQAIADAAGLERRFGPR